MATGTHLPCLDEWISFCQTQLKSDHQCNSEPLDRKPLQPHTLALANFPFSVASSYVGDTYFAEDQAANRSCLTQNCKSAASLLPWKASSSIIGPRFLASDEIKSNFAFGHSAQTSSSPQESFPGRLIQNLENSDDCTFMSPAMNASHAYVEGVENLAVAERATIGELIERLRNNLQGNALLVSHAKCLTSLGMGETHNTRTGFCSLEASDYGSAVDDASRHTFSFQELTVPNSHCLKASTSVSALAEPFSRSHFFKNNDLSFAGPQQSLNKGDIHSGVLLPNDTTRVNGYASTHNYAQGALSDHTPMYTSPEEAESSTGGGPADSSNSKPVVKLEACASVHPVDDSILKKQKVLHEVNLPNILQEASSFKRQSVKTVQTGAIEEPLVKNTKGTGSMLSEARTKADRRKSNNLQNAATQSMKGTSKSHEPPKQDYIHVRARRGQATDSHSLAERARREKISERMKFLQDLVPGCNKITGKALMLDEIINYVQSLQYQVEFLSMKLAAFTSRRDSNFDIVATKQFSEAFVYQSDAPQHADQKAQLHQIYQHEFQDVRSPSYVPQSNLKRVCNPVGHGCQYPDAVPR